MPISSDGDTSREASVMRKIPTLFLRDENDRRYVTDEVNPACQWALA